MAVPYTFASATSAIPLSQLDANFATTITLGNTAIQLGNTVTTLNNMTMANVTISSVATAITAAQGGTGLTAVGTTGNVLTSNGTAWISQAPGAASGNVTIGNTTINLGGTATTVGNLTLANTTVTNYTETLYTATGNVTVSLTNGTIQEITTSGSTTITLPSSVSGKSFTIIVKYAAADALTWAGGSTLKWANSTTPTPTSVANKFDIFSFFQDGTNTYGVVNGQNY